MKERTEYLLRQIQKLEQRRNDETDEDIRQLIDDKIKALQKELFDLQENLQPQRFEQVISIIIEKCQEMIDSNEIFVDGDKDIFLSRYVEPFLNSSNLNTIQENHRSIKSVLNNRAVDSVNDIPGYIRKYSLGLDNRNTLISKMLNYIQTHKKVSWQQFKKACVTEFGCTNEQSGSIGASLKALEYLNKIRVDGKGESKIISICDILSSDEEIRFSKPNFLRTYKEILEQTNRQVEIFHYFSETKRKATATFDLYSKKMMYNGEPNMSPSAAANKATREITGKNSSLNGWIFWKYVDASGNEKTIENLR